MGAAGEQVGSHGIFQGVAPLLQQRHIPGQRGGVAGNIHDAPGRKTAQGFNGIGIQALSGRIYHHHIGFDSLLFQLQSRLTGITAEKFRIFDAVALGIFLCIGHRLGNDLHTDDLSGSTGHGQSDGSHTAV